MTAETPDDENSGVRDSRVRKCPDCKSEMRRISRTPVMRMLVGSKRYYCDFCQRKYLYFLRLRLPI